MSRSSSVLFLLWRQPTLVSPKLFVPEPLRYVRWQSSSSDSKDHGKRTPLYDLHMANKGKMVNFAGFQLPVQYGSDGIATSHRHTRAHCSLFDVSHMLQTEIRGADRVLFFESLCTADVTGLPDNNGSLSLFTSDSGGILDDLIVNKTSEGYLYVVSNAGRRVNDQALMLKAQEHYHSQHKDVTVEFLRPEDRALIALQGPLAWQVLQPLVDIQVMELYFMMTSVASVCGVAGCRVTRCGYTGEDGFEISIPARASMAVVQDILQSSVAPVKLAGLGARDTLRLAGGKPHRLDIMVVTTFIGFIPLMQHLPVPEEMIGIAVEYWLSLHQVHLLSAELEAGLCLYGNDIDETTTPVSAALAWTIGKRRRQAKDFPGAEMILNELKEKPKRRRVGLKSEGRGPPARLGAQIMQEGRVVGQVTSGCPSPSLGINIAMGYVDSSLAQPGTRLEIKVRDSFIGVVVCKLPFIQSKYYTKT